MLTKSIKEKILKELKKMKPEILNISRRIHAQPELMYSEFFASEFLTDILKQNNFTVTRGSAGIKTAFTARYNSVSKRKKPAIALIAEYDALPGMGHACGHNMIAAISIGAGIALARAGIGEEASLSIIGTPAEEGGGGKIHMIEKGVFNGFDAALMAHPSNKTRCVAKMLAIGEMIFTFKGKPAHAAAFPYEGVNALDGVILTFNNINALRQQIKSDARIHGIITAGGAAPNIIPERAVARFFVRASDLTYFYELQERVKKCAQGAALATGCKVRVTKGKTVYEPFKPNYEFVSLFRRHILDAGLQEGTMGEAEGVGSSDIGNLSQILPTIHPEFAIAPKNIINHTPEFSEAAVSQKGEESMLCATQAIALTTAELILSPTTLQSIKKEFKNKTS